MPDLGLNNLFLILSPFATDLLSLFLPFTTKSKRLFEFVLLKFFALIFLISLKPFGDVFYTFLLNEIG